MQKSRAISGEMDSEFLPPRALRASFVHPPPPYVFHGVKAAEQGRNPKDAFQSFYVVEHPLLGFEENH